LEVGHQEEELESTSSEDEVEAMLETGPEIDIFKLIEGIRTWSLQSSIDSSLHSHLSAIERFVIEEKVRNRIQKKITDYFPPTPNSD